MLAVNVPIGNRYFDGTDDYVDLGEVSALKITSSFTLTGWFKIDSMPSGIEYLLGWGTKGYYVYIDGANKRLVVGYVTSTGQAEQAMAWDYWWSDGRWHMFALARDGSGYSIRFYVDDMVYYSFSTSANPVYQSGESLAIGRKGSSASNYFKGNLRDFRLYNYRVEDEDVEKLVYRTAEPETAPIAQWLLDETSGSTAADNVGSNDGTYYGGSGSSITYKKLRDVVANEETKVKVGSDWVLPKSIFIKSGTWKRVHEPLEIYNPESQRANADLWYPSNLHATYRTVTFNSDRITYYHEFSGFNEFIKMSSFNQGMICSSRHLIDVTNLTTLYIDWELLRTYGTGNYCFVRFGISTSDTSISPSPSVTGNYGFSRRTDSVNVSSSSGLFYLILNSFNGMETYIRTANIYRIWAV